jgi:hypothetical protein
MPGKGGGSSTVNVHNDGITVDADSTVDINGLDKINVTLNPQPFKTESKLDLTLPQPFKTDSKLDLTLPQPFKTDSKLDTTSDITSDSKSALTVDLKPVAVDLCLNTSSKLPQGQIQQPFSLHFGFTWFGVEVFGFNLGGETRTVLQDLPKHPAVDWPAQHNAPPPDPARAAYGAPYGATYAPPGTFDRGCREDAPAARDGGLRIRIK